MNGSILNSTLVALSIGGLLALLAFLSGRSRPASRPDLSRVVFRYRFLPRFLTIAASVVLPTATTFLVNYFPPLREQKVYIAAAYFVIGSFCLPLVWESEWFYISLDANSIQSRSAWRGSRTFTWDDVTGLSYSSLNMWFILRLTDGAKIRVPLLVGNLKELLSRIEGQLPVDALRHARVGYEKVGRPFPALVNDPILEARSPR